MGYWTELRLIYTSVLYMHADYEAEGMPRRLPHLNGRFYKGGIYAWSWSLLERLHLVTSIYRNLFLVYTKQLTTTWEAANVF